ncbi:hypothetical protein HK414_11990 [Ramlibacter terrae]|uniref:General stress protein 17M-like domain-containing protein n=1 Tax=Ramlibacter terrae TaxID=2732511 RepID=A0ABX6P2K4_9BURK|nr:hypothetical protein HK414_11990 [Ramlibacter terrae]
MHTAICAFNDRASADRAVEQLVAAGIDRRDVHVEHRGGEVEDRNALENFGRFFASLLGRDDPTAHADTYGKHVERGGLVVVVDARDADEADRASRLLHELQASDTNVLHRPEQRPLRDIVGERQATGMERSFGTARGEMPQGTRGRQDSVEEDRAMAAARAGDKPAMEDGERPGVKPKNMGRADGI